MEPRVLLLKVSWLEEIEADLRLEKKGSLPEGSGALSVEQVFGTI